MYVMLMTKVEKAEFEFSVPSEHDYLVMYTKFQNYIEDNGGLETYAEDVAQLAHVHGCTVYQYGQPKSLPNPETKTDMRVRILGEHKPLVEKIESELRELYKKYM